MGIEAFCERVRKDLLGDAGSHVDYKGFAADALKNLDRLQALRKHPAELYSPHGLDRVFPAKRKKFENALYDVLDREYSILLENLRKADTYISGLSSENRKIDACAPKLGDYASALIEKKSQGIKGLDARLDAINREIISLSNEMFVWDGEPDQGIGSPIDRFSELFHAKNSLAAILNELPGHYDLAIGRVKSLKSEMESRRRSNGTTISELRKCKAGLDFYLEMYSFEDYQKSIAEAGSHYGKKSNLWLGAYAALGAAAVLSALLLVKPPHPGKTADAIQKPSRMVEIVPAPGFEQKEDESYLPQDVEAMFRGIPGRIPIEMFHYIANERNTSIIRGLGIQDRYVVSAGELRRHFDELYRRGFRPISLQEYSGDLSSLPEGTKPILFTIDDATFGQFDLISTADSLSFGNPARFDYKGSSLVLDPDCFVAILREFNAKHPDFRARAAFAVDFANTHATGYEPPFLQEEYVGLKLNLLLDWGFDIVNHGMRHRNYSKLTPDEARKDAGMALSLMQRHLGYRIAKVDTFAFPYGAVPDAAALEALKSFSYNGAHYENRLLFAAWGGAAANAYNNSQQLIIPRIEVCASTFDSLVYNRNDFYRTPGASLTHVLPGNGQTLR